MKRDWRARLVPGSGGACIYVRIISAHSSEVINNKRRKFSGRVELISDGTCRNSIRKARRMQTYTQTSKGWE